MLVRKTWPEGGKVVRNDTHGRGVRATRAARLAVSFSNPSEPQVTDRRRRILLDEVAGPLSAAVRAARHPGGRPSFLWATPAGAVHLGPEADVRARAVRDASRRCMASARSVTGASCPSRNDRGAVTGLRAALRRRTSVTRRKKRRRSGRAQVPPERRGNAGRATGRESGPRMHRQHRRRPSRHGARPYPIPRPGEGCSACSGGRSGMPPSSRSVRREAEASARRRRSRRSG